MKSEPTAYSIDDLEREKVTMWDGVRNYQARNFMRDMEQGDLILFYHSNTAPVGIVGVAKVLKTAYPDPTQFDPKDGHYDPSSTKGNPRWDVVDVSFVRKFKEPLTLHELKNDPFFADMPVTQKGSRLSVQPVAVKHYQKVAKLRP